MKQFKNKVKEIENEFAVGDKVWHPRNGVALRVIVELGNIDGEDVMTVAELEPYSIPSLFIVRKGWIKCK